MPQVTDQDELRRKFSLELVSRGPERGMWRGQYLRCPRCDYHVLKGPGYDECPCGNIAVDSDMLRVAVRDTPEAEVETYNAVPKPVGTP